MGNRKPVLATRKMPPGRKAKLRRDRRLIVLELADLVAHDHMRREASDEQTLSGELGRAIHASELPLARIAREAGVTALTLDEFLTGERTLRSDTLDRLAHVLGWAPAQGGR